MGGPAEIHVLITRSEPEGRQLAGKVAELGCHALRAPAVILGPAENREAVREAILEQPRPDGVIVTSPAGLQEAISLLGPGWFNQQPLLVPGPATAERARCLGVAEVVSPPASGDSEALLALPLLKRVGGQQWMILAAAGGRRLLEQTLAERGARVVRHHVYQRLPAPMPRRVGQLFRAREPMVLMLASAAALSWLRTMVDQEAWPYLSRQAAVAPSKRVARKAREAGFLHVVEAGGADDAAMLQALVEVLKQGGFG